MAGAESTTACRQWSPKKKQTGPSSFETKPIETPSISAPPPLSLSPPLCFPLGPACLTATACRYCHEGLRLPWWKQEPGRGLLGLVRRGGSAGRNAVYLLRLLRCQLCGYFAATVATQYATALSTFPTSKCIGQYWEEMYSPKCVCSFWRVNTLRVGTFRLNFCTKLDKALFLVLKRI